MRVDYLEMEITNLFNITGYTILALPGALAHCMQNPKWMLRGPKMANKVWKGVLVSTPRF